MFYIFLVLCFSSICAQSIDDFSDGNLNIAPAWGGDTASWVVVSNSSSGTNVSGAMTLRLNAPSDGSPSQYISLSPDGGWEGTLAWGTWIGRRSSSSFTATNRFYYYLWSNTSNLESDTLSGYRILIGDNVSDDELFLERVDHGIPTVILTSSGAIPNGLGDISLLIRITRTSLGGFSLYTSLLPDSNGKGPSPLLPPSASNTNYFQGSAVDATYSPDVGGYLGYQVIHTSSSTARTSIELDQIWHESNSDFSLPVSLSLFKIKLTDHLPELVWVTESEFENLGYEILRADLFSPREIIASYKNTIGLAGKGSTSERSNYSFKDFTAGTGINYEYTLHQIDYDGKTTPLGTLNFKTGSEETAIGFDIYPNPAHGIVNFAIDDRMKFSELSVYNLLGQEVDRIDLKTVVVGKTFSTNRANKLPAGYYIASMKTGSSVKNRGFLVLP